MKTLKGILLVLAIPIILIGGVAYLIIKHSIEKYRAKNKICITCNGKFGIPQSGKYQCERCMQPYNQLQ